MSLSVEEQLVFNYFKIVSVSEIEETEKLFKEIVQSSANKENSVFNLGNVLTSINRLIKNYDMEIVEAVDEVSMKKIHCLIATSTSSVTEKANFYSKQTCDLLSKIIQECVMSKDGYVSEALCLTLTAGSKNEKTVEDSLKELINDKWLLSKNGNISLGMRCKLELEVLIKKNFPKHVKHCSLCRLFMVEGFTCSECESHVHFHCMKKYYQINKMLPSQRMCPICKEETNGMSDERVEMMSRGSGVDGPPAKRSKTFVHE